MATIQELREAYKASEAAAAKAELASDAAIELLMESGSTADREAARVLHQEARDAYHAYLEAKHTFRQAELGY